MTTENFVVKCGVCESVRPITTLRCSCGSRSAHPYRTAAPKPEPEPEDVAPGVWLLPFDAEIASGDTVLIETVPQMAFFPLALLVTPSTSAAELFVEQALVGRQVLDTVGYFPPGVGISIYDRLGLFLPFGSDLIAMPGVSISLRVLNRGYESAPCSGAFVGVASSEYDYDRKMRRMADATRRAFAIRPPAEALPKEKYTPKVEPEVVEQIEEREVKRLEERRALTLDDFQKELEPKVDWWKG